LLYPHRLSILRRADRPSRKIGRQDVLRKAKLLRAVLFEEFLEEVVQGGDDVVL